MESCAPVALTLSGPNASLSTLNSYCTSLRTSPLMTSLHSEIHDHLTTRDRGATHKLKPRSFIKVVLCSNILHLLLESSFGVYTTTKSNSSLT